MDYNAAAESAHLQDPIRCPTYQRNSVLDLERVNNAQRTVRRLFLSQDELFNCSAFSCIQMAMLVLLPRYCACFIYICYNSESATFRFILHYKLADILATLMQQLHVA
jgi:hypothetical protein